MFEKDEGSSLMSVFTVMWLAAIVVILVLVSFRLEAVSYTKSYVEDGIVFANLASDLADIEAYGSTGDLVVTDFENSYSKYQEALKDNLKLDSSYESSNSEVISGKVTTHVYSIYNVSGNDVTVKTRNSDGTNSYDTLDSYPGAKGAISTPDGTIVNTTTVYSKIGFNVKGFKDQIHYVYKENSVDLFSE